MPRIWTELQRQRQSELILQQRPWTHSTGPKTLEGKAKVAQNRLKHGFRSKPMRQLISRLAAMKREMKEYLSV